MATKKKRTGLDALGLSAENVTPIEKPEKNVKPVKEVKKPEISKSNPAKANKKIAKTTVYVPQEVYEQWRELAFTERKKMHDYLLEGLDMVFHNRGLKSIEDLTSE